MASKICDVLLDICQESNARLSITTSRRTHSDSEDVIRAKLLNNKLCCFLVIASEPQKESPVPGILGISDIVIVTEDSLSMVCEAASSGRKVVLLKVERKKRDGEPKREKVYQMLSKNGYVRKAQMQTLKNVVMDFINEASAPKVLDDAQTAANAMDILRFQTRDPGFGK
jgi:mitochondrial fission protein ELM1